tara:strand:+ start:156 stop:533 length:378 start_codon:yes stop_codon:yes gene_type:complete
MTIELLLQRVELLEKQISILLADKKFDEEKVHDIKPNKEKKQKKEKKSKISNDSDEESKSKKKRISGYLLYSSAMRYDVKNDLFGDDKPKNSDIMVELGKRWKALTDEEREEWNNKAKDIKESTD